MNGQAAIEDLRRTGRRPVAVFLLDYKPTPRMEAWPISDQMARGVIPALYVYDADPARSDLRFLHGIRVHLYSDDQTRALAWVDALLEAGAERVFQSNAQEVFEWPL